MKNIAIIGCGYVGTEVARYWHQLGYVLTVTTTTPDRVAELEAVAQGVVIVKGNDAIGLRSVLEKQDTVVVTVGAANRQMYAEAYLETAQTLVSVLREVPRVRQVIYTGSYAVYGDKDGVWVDESSPVDPANPNVQILCDTEEVLLSAARENLRVCILRLGGIYGPGREIIKIFRRAAGTTRPGKGTEATNWIHLDDIVGAIAFADDQQLEGIYNLVDDEHLTNREFLDRVFAKHSLPNVTWDARSKRSYNAWVSNQKIKAAGYQLIHPQRMV